MRIHLVLPYIIVLVAAPLSTAAAGPVTWAFEGEVTRVFDHHGILGGEVEAGDILEGFYTFESSSQPDVPGSGFYVDAVSSFSSSIDGVEFSGPHGSTRRIIVLDDFFLDGSDRYVVEIDVAHQQQQLYFGIEYFDFSGDSFSSNALPTDPSSWVLFDENMRRFTISGADEALRIDGNITSLTLGSV